MIGRPVILRGPVQREYGKRLIDAAPFDALLTIKEGIRTLDQNAKMWAMLFDISAAKSEGRKHTPEVWKCLFMSACGHAVQFEIGLDDKPFPVGFRTSRLSKRQMADLITFVAEYGDRHGVKWSDTHE